MAEIINTTKTISLGTHTDEKQKTQNQTIFEIDTLPTEYDSEVREKIPPFSVINSVTMQVSDYRFFDFNNYKDIFDAIEYPDGDKTNRFGIRVRAYHYYPYTNSDGTKTHLSTYDTIANGAYRHSATWKTFTEENPSSESFILTDSSYARAADFSSNTENAGFLRKPDFTADDYSTRQIYLEAYQGSQTLALTQTATYSCKVTATVDMEYNIRIPQISIYSNNNSWGTITGTEANNTYNIDVDSSYEITPTPTANHRFVKWNRQVTTNQPTATSYNSEKLLINKDKLNDNKTRIEAEFVPIYPVYINLNGGKGEDESKNNQPAFYYDKYGRWYDTKKTVSGTVTLKVPTKNGYTFKGWKDLSTGTVYETFTINNATDTKTYNLEAVWEANSYQVKTLVEPEDAGSLLMIIDYQDGVNSATMNYDKMFQFSINHSNSKKYTFEGIQLIKDGKTEMYSSNKYSDLEFAQWKFHTDDASFDFTSNSEFIYKAIYKLNSNKIKSVTYYIQNPENKKFEAVNKECAFIEVDGVGISPDKLYEYDKKVTVNLIPKFGYELYSWKITTDSTNYNSSKTPFLRNVQFQTNNQIEVYLVNANISKDTLGEDGETEIDPEGKLVKDLTDSILNKTVKRFIDKDATLQRVGEYSFYNCKDLQTVLFGHTDIIGAHAFEGCESLISIKLPAGRGLAESRMIMNSAFKNCKNLNTIIITDGFIDLGGTDVFEDTPFDLEDINPDNLSGNVGYFYVDDPSEYYGKTNWAAYPNEMFRAISDYPNIDQEEK